MARAATRPRLGLLGAFQLRDRGRGISIGHGSERVLAFVSLHEGAVRRTRIAGSLWLDTDEEHAAASLRSELWRLRRRGADVIEVSDDSVALGSNVRVDVREVERVARTLLDDEAVGSPREVETLALAGDLLPGWYDDWVLVERENLRDLRLRALEKTCHALTARGRYADAAKAGLGAVAIEPLRESAHRALMTLHIAEGNTAEALRQYELYAQLLRSRLALEPSPLIDALVEQISRRRVPCASARPGS